MSSQNRDRSLPSPPLGDGAQHCSPSVHCSFWSHLERPMRNRTARGIVQLLFAASASSAMLPDLGPGGFLQTGVGVDDKYNFFTIMRRSIRYASYVVSCKSLLFLSSCCLGHAVLQKLVAICPFSQLSRRNKFKPHLLYFKKSYIDILDTSSHVGARHGDQMHIYAFWCCARTAIHFELLEKLLWEINILSSKELGCDEQI